MASSSDLLVVWLVWQSSGGVGDLLMVWYIFWGLLWRCTSSWDISSGGVFSWVSFGGVFHGCIYWWCIFWLYNLMGVLSGSVFSWNVSSGGVSVGWLLVNGSV